MMNKFLAAASMACAVVLATAVPALAWEGGDHPVAAYDEKKSGSVGVPESRAGCARETTRTVVSADEWPAEQGTIDELDDNGPESDHGSARDDCASCAAGISVARAVSTGDDGASTDHVDSGHARAPPASPSAPPPTGIGG